MENLAEGKMSSEETEMVLTDRIQEIKEELASESELKKEDVETDPFVEKDENEAKEEEVKDEIGQFRNIHQM